MENKFEEFYQAQAVVEDILRRDLIGPVEDNEILAELPSQYYIMGKLYPKRQKQELEEEPSEDVDKDTDANESVASKQENNFNQSSMGITFVIKPDTEAIQVDVQYSLYAPIVRAEPKGKEAIQWQRCPYERSQRIDTAELAKGKYNKYELSDNIWLHVFCNYILSSGNKIITISLLNDNKSAQKMVDDQGRIIFQAGMRISGEAGQGIFEDIDLSKETGQDDELRRLELLYYNQHNYAQGHGCSVAWDMEHTVPQWVATEFLPTYQLRQMMPRPFDIGDDSGKASPFNMKRLAEADAAVLAELSRFNEKYGNWIRENEAKLHSYPVKFHDIGQKNLAKCQEVYELIAKTLKALSRAQQENTIIWKAFRYANEAMFMQRMQMLKNKGIEADAAKINWYPFQLTFFLCEIYSFIEPNSAERSRVDLLWFPTGGGKTEAYLGIAAFVIFLRRLKDSSADGVTVIMRYTLRLLTMQQFERAAAMIIACEILRQKYQLGGEAITIGLWVGDRMVANSLAAANTILQSGKDGADGDPRQIKKCPWCGAVINASNYSIDMNAARMNIACPNEACPVHGFDHGMPVHLVDDTIYKHLPTFLVATVDKFAQLPRDNRCHAIFGRIPPEADKLPPELIIQDEMHLLTGPLGTMVGLYESAVTEFCNNTNGNIPVKVISSTATIRNAEAQIRSLYGRDYAQFPPQGIDAEDSYFAVISGREDRPARTYYGIMGQGTTGTNTHIRVNGALLYATRYLASCSHRFSDRVVDNCWTLLNYFNALRELGASLLQIQDEVQKRFAYLAENKFAKHYPLEKKYKQISHNVIQEVSSKLNNAEIPDALAKMERPWRREEPRDAMSFVLATNMISVGMDIGRMGIMVMTGQPKTNAEYIQATSRVGRTNPGGVFTVYNGMRSRDKSHYEQFVRYHKQLYRYVEASSLTPFSERAMDRGLQALLVAYARFYIEDMATENSASAIIEENNLEQVREIAAHIVEYIRRVDGEEAESAAKRLDELIDYWVDRAVNRDLCYKLRGKGHNTLIGSDIELENEFRMMNSMRSVEEACAVYYKE